MAAVLFKINSDRRLHIPKAAAPGHEFGKA
jgi:hypothetical protein